MVFAHTEMKHDSGEGNLLGRFKSALDLVHGVDAAGLFDVDEVERRSDMTAPLGIGVERLVQCGSNIVRTEPLRNLTNHGAVGVVEVVPRGKHFDALGTAAHKRVEQAGVQALLKEDLRGDSGLHHFIG
jgi:hypothetical protein